MMPRTLPRSPRLPPAWVTWNESRSYPFTKWGSLSGRSSNSTTHLITCCLQLSTRLKALVHSFAPRVSTPIDKSLSCLSFQVEARVVIFIPGEASAWTYAHGLYLLSLAFSVSRAEPSFEVVFETSDGLKAVQAREKLQPAVILLNIGLPVLTEY